MYGRVALQPPASPSGFNTVLPVCLKLPPDPELRKGTLMFCALSAPRPGHIGLATLRVFPPMPSLTRRIPLRL
jgi:hypothetical protein